MTKFKKGDRVKCTYGVSAGRVGVVLEDSKRPWVRFDDCRKEVYCGGPVWMTGYESGHLDTVIEDNLTLVDQPLSTTPDKVLQAAKTSPQAKDALKALFPDVFKESSQPFEFGWTYAIPCSNPNHPLSIGIAGVPFSPLEGRCLVMDNSLWEMKTQQYCGRTILTFHKKP